MKHSKGKSSLYNAVFELQEFVQGEEGFSESWLRICACLDVI